jgi:hypothetical protein
MAKNGIHTKPVRGNTDEWLTPPELLRALGSFDLDPCSPIVRPWETATRHLSELDDGLSVPWVGRVWLNPPYGPETIKWVRKLSEHGNGIALIFARTETEMFHKFIWPIATGILFLKGRLHFHYPDGSRSGDNAGGPHCLVSYGVKNAFAVEDSGIPGYFIRLR